MAAFKGHLVTDGKDRGDVSADYRGDKFIGHDQHDEHHTVFEIDPIPEDDIDEALELAQRLNAMMVRAGASVAIPKPPIPIPEVGDKAFLRFGVWDN